ncbi:MAG: hypothetical protein HC915_19590 [Anaerolineae bacterium]|nr:hypothetical protein [Anaerolineae bacterium]
MSDGVDSFVASLDEVLRFLESYRDDLFYLDINPAPPPAGARHFEITTFPPEVATRLLDALHPGPAAPRLTPLARQKLPQPVSPLKVSGTLECGVNIQPRYGQGGVPIPSVLGRAAWVRFPFLSSPAWFPSVEEAFRFYDPIIAAYRELGTQVLLILTHQTYGEEASFNWNAMSSQRWRDFTPPFCGARAPDCSALWRCHCGL